MLDFILSLIVIAIVVAVLREYIVRRESNKFQEERNMMVKEIEKLNIEILVLKDELNGERPSRPQVEKYVPTLSTQVRDGKHTTSSVRKS